jgi:hypothetical protein
VIDLSSSSNEEGLVIDTSRDEEFARRLFGDLNCAILGPHGYSKIIILSDSDKEEEEVREEKTAGTRAAATVAAVHLASTVDADEAPEGVQDNNGGEHTPDQGASDGSTGGDEAGLP